MKIVSTTDIGHSWSVLSRIFSSQANAVVYADWIELNEEFRADVLATQRVHALSLKYRPKFSIVVATFNTPSGVLNDCVESVLNQSYPDWELCIADNGSSTEHVKIILDRYVAQDERIKVAYRTSNGHKAKATNTALSIATGAYVCPMDHEDTITPNALYEFALKVNEDPALDFIYSDEDRLSPEGTLRFDPHFKPDWSPEYLECYMYTAHFACYRAETVRQTGGFRREFAGAQDYDFMLRFSLTVSIKTMYCESFFD